MAVKGKQKETTEKRCMNDAKIIDDNHNGSDKNNISCNKGRNNNNNYCKQ